jgi:hypothetical protein
MKLPRKITATAISALALVLGITTIQAPSALAVDRTLEAPRADRAVVSGGQAVTFTFLGPMVGDLAGSTGGGVGRIVLRQGGNASTDAVLVERGLQQAGTRLSVVAPDAPGAEVCAISAWPGGRVIDPASPGNAPTYFQVPAISAETCVPIRAQSTIFPRAPYLTPTGGGTAIYPTASVGITAHLGGGIFTQEQVLSRGVTTSFTGTSNPTACTSGSEAQTVNAAGAGSGVFAYQRTIPGGTVGQYFCMQQFVKTDLMDSITYSEPVTFQVTSNPNVGAGSPNVNLGSALARLQEATQRLQQVQGQPNVDQAALAAAAAEAEEARRQAEAAAAQAQAQAAAAAAQGQAAPAGAPSAAQIAQVQQAAEAANAQVEQAIGQSTAGTGKPTALSALAIATGFDPFTTPVLQAREKNASGVSIEVTAPETIRQKKRLRTKLEVLDPVTRGGMRQYLLDLNGPTPKLLLKRTGFVPKGEKNKRYWISKNFQPGTYGLLTTFLPSTPGMQGVAVYDTIEVTEAPKKKKKKGKKNRN